MDWCSSCRDVIGPWLVLIIIHHVDQTKGRKGVQGRLVWNSIVRWR